MVQRLLIFGDAVCCENVPNQLAQWDGSSGSAVLLWYADPGLTKLVATCFISAVTLACLVSVLVYSSIVMNGSR